MADKMSDSKIELKVSAASKLESPLNLSGYSGSAAEKIKTAVAEKSVVIFGKTWCPFCLEVRSLFESLGVPFHVFNFDVEAEGSSVHSALKDTHNQTTVPYVFVGGDLIGGCDATKAALADGRLVGLLRAAGCKPRTAKQSRVLGVLEGKRRVPTTFFSFPEAADDRAVRLTSFWSLVICILVAAFYTRNQSRWVMVGLMVDYCLRIVGGGNLSPLGSLSSVCVAILDAFGSKPQWRAGPPKQFAALCGLMFSGLASFFFLVDIYDDKLDIVALSFVCALGAAAALEALLGFCLGCFFFSLMVQFGIVSKEVYHLYTSILPEVEYTYEFVNSQLDMPEPKRSVKYLVDEATPLSIDYKYKEKDENLIKDDWHIVKHVKISHFYMHMGIAGLACAWKVATHQGILAAPDAVFQAIALGSSFLYTIWLFLYLARMILYPAKCLKEWQCPLRGNAFVVPFVCLVLYAYLVYNENLILGEVLFWMGAPAGMALSIFRVGEWLCVRRDLEHVHVAWMVMPVQNFVSAMVGPILSADYTDACQFWFGFAFVAWVLLFSLTFFKAILKKDDDDRNRPLMAIWVAAPAVMGCAYLQCFLPDYMSYFPGNANAGTFSDFIFINMQWFSISIALVLLVGFYLPFFGRLRFDMAYWAAGFPSAALAMIALFYHGVKGGKLSGGIAIACLALASVLNCTLALQTLSFIIRKKIFVPDYKWGPLSYMRLTHEAFRGALPRLVAAAKALAEAGAPDSSLADELAELWRLMSLAHEEHGRHEDDVIFKAYNDIFPGVASQWNDDHVEHHEMVKKLDNAVAEACKGGAAAALVPMLEQYAVDFEKHMVGEESHLVGLPRRYLPLEMHKQIIRKTWEMTDAKVWAEYIPWVLNNLPMLQQRTRFIKTLLWAMPERAQHIGIMVALGVDDVQWTRLTVELPEIIPRGAQGWERYY